MMNPTDEHLQNFLAHYGEALSAGDLKPSPTATLFLPLCCRTRAASQSPRARR